MALTVQFYTSTSPAEKIGKTLTAGISAACTLKDDTSILRPELFITSATSPAGYNYMYISDFGRYYFIDDIKSIHNNMWEISAHVDVLETYATAIKANSAVIKRQANKFNLYLDDPEFKTYNNEQLQTKKFAVPSGGGFTKSLRYIMTVNGSYGSSENGGGDNNNGD